MKFFCKLAGGCCVLLISIVTIGGTVHCSLKTVDGVQWKYLPMGKVAYSISHGRAILGWSSFTETAISGGYSYSHTDDVAISTTTAGKVSIPEVGETDIRGHAFWNCAGHRQKRI